jgi:LmbE family N-acetylglucosaminyl deacetylase
MDKLSRRSMLRGSYSLAGAVATSLPAGSSQARAKRPEADRKLRVVAVGGHFDDPQTCAGGTLTLFADQGHDVVALSITGGPPPTPDMNPEEREVKNRLNAMRMAEILKIRLVCMKYHGSSSVMRHILSSRTPHAIFQPSSQIGDERMRSAG